jgi:hypothetical protein
VIYVCLVANLLQLSAAAAPRAYALLNRTWGSCLGGTPAARTASSALDAFLEPAAGLPRRRCGLRPVVVSLDRGTPPLPATPTHWSCANFICLLIMASPPSIQLVLLLLLLLCGGNLYLWDAWYYCLGSPCTSMASLDFPCFALLSCWLGCVGRSILVLVLESASDV